MDIKLNFINQASDAGNATVVICQKNATGGSGAPVVAWKVIRNCAPGSNHPFTLPATMEVGAADSYGNQMPHMAAQVGQVFQVVLKEAGVVLELASATGSPSEVQVLNALATGAIDASIYKAGTLLATRTAIAPQQKAVFAFNPVIWIGVASQVEQGQEIDTAALSRIDTELSLIGVAQADIVMTGGGMGPNSAPFQFTLANVVMA